MLKELLWSCYETAMELPKNAHKTQQDTSVSNCEIPVAFRYYLCTDSSGLSVGTSRVVEVGCEGPNPSGTLMQGICKEQNSRLSGKSGPHPPPFLKLKFTQLVSTADRDTINIH